VPLVNDLSIEYEEKKGGEREAEPHESPAHRRAKSSRRKGGGGERRPMDALQVCPQILFSIPPLPSEKRRRREGKGRVHSTRAELPQSLCDSNPSPGGRRRKMKKGGSDQFIEASQHRIYYAIFGKRGGEGGRVAMYPWSAIPFKGREKRKGGGCRTLLFLYYILN